MKPSEYHWIDERDRYHRSREADVILGFVYGALSVFVSMLALYVLTN